MKAIVLAGGYAKRMWPLTKNRPKHLLPVAGRPMLDYVMKNLGRSSEIDEIYLSTNMKFRSRFQKYLDGLNIKKSLHLFVEETYSEEEKLGSVGALGFLIRENSLNDDLLVIGGDNIFSFEMSDFIGYFYSKGANTIALYDVKSKEKARLYGVVQVDKEKRIIDFQEKPKKMGRFIEWLYKHDAVYGYVFTGVWFDIGSFESYKAADKYFSRLKSNIENIDFSRRRKRV